jgi:hypothetical protein
MNGGGQLTKCLENCVLALLQDPDPQKRLPHLDLLFDGRQLSNTFDMCVDGVADILELERPALERRTKNLFPRVLLHLLVPPCRPDAELHNLHIGVGQMAPDLFGGMEPGDELGVWEDIADFRECLRDLARELFVVQRGLEEKFHGPPHERGVLGIRRHEGVDCFLVLYHLGRRPLPPRHGCCHRLRPPRSFRVVSDLAFFQYSEHILHRRCLGQPGLTLAVLEGDFVKQQGLIIGVSYYVWRRCPGGTLISYGVGRGYLSKVRR